MTDAETTFSDRLRRTPSVALTVVAGHHGDEVTLSISTVFRNARSLSGQFQNAGLVPGDRVAVLMPTSPRSVESILAAWFAGAAFSFLPWTASKSRSALQLHRLRSMMDVLKPKIVIITEATASRVDPQQYPNTKFIKIDTSSPRHTAAHCSISGSDLAFVQFTSGSTAEDPRGVAVKHAQLVDNIAGIGEKICIQEDDVMVSWAPLHHDMGLVALLLSLYYGIRLVLIPTETFGRRPAIWLETIDRFRGTLSPAPPFAFNLLTKRPAFRNQKLDLSSWRYAWVGAEPIFPAQLNAFEAVYRGAGLGTGVLQGTYGLAESVVVVANGRAGSPRCQKWFDGNRLRETGEAVSSESSSPGALELVACGTPNRNMELRVADEQGNGLGECRQGRILIRGPSVMERYFGHDAARAEDEWLDTGDLGFLCDGQIFVLGRAKDLIKRGGVGIAPQDIEWTVERELNLNTGRAVAFSYLCHSQQVERIVVLVEDKRSQKSEIELENALVSAVAREVGIQIDRIEFVGPNAIPRTTSGKLKRDQARKLYLNGELPNATL